MAIHSISETHPWEDEIHIQRFRSYINTQAVTDCWVWQGQPHSMGYGVFTINGKQWLAHRYAWIIHNHAYPIQEVRHICDNRPCVNPSHLLEGTHKQNMEDMALRGRSTHGEKNRHAKLTHEKVRVIRHRFSQGCSRKI